MGDLVFATKKQAAQTAKRPAPNARFSHQPKRMSPRFDVQGVVAEPGEQLQEEIRRTAQRNYHFDLSSIRIHADAAAAESARMLDASAYTVGQHIVFGRDRYQPHSPGGRRLLAHELAHTAQQRSVPDSAIRSSVEVGPRDDRYEREANQQSGLFDGASHAAMAVSPLRQPRIQRSFASDFFSLSTGPFKAIARAFGSENYSDQELHQYLDVLIKTGKIEDNYDSDNKARAIASRLESKQPGFTANGHVRALLIREMTTGHVSTADGEGVLAVVRSSTDAELKEIFGLAGMAPKVLLGELNADQARALQAFFETHLEGGTKAALTGHIEPTTHIQAPFDKANIDAFMEQRIRRIESYVKSKTVPSSASGADKEKIRDKFKEEVPKEVRRKVDEQAAEFFKELQVLSLDEQNRAVEEISAIRAQQDLILKVSKLKPEPADDQPWLDWIQNLLIPFGAVRMLDAVLLSAGRDIAQSAPADKNQFEASTQALTAAQKTEATKALDPVTMNTIEANIEIKNGGPAPKPKPFEPGVLPGEKKNYQQHIEGRIPDLIEEHYSQMVVGKGEKEHANPALTHQLSEVETVAQASQIEVEKVFGSFIQATPKNPKGHGKPLVADTFHTTGKKKGQIDKKGQLHDLFQSEEARKAADPTYQEGAARFWMFYLILNDKDGRIDSNGEEVVDYTNLKHYASPIFSDGRVPQNKEAKLIASAAEKLLPKNTKRLYEIGRGWPAVNTGRGEIALQLFKNPDANKDRSFLWDQFETLIHEYLHSLANDRYNRYAEHLGGESDNRGNTLIEGVDSLLTETVWKNAERRAPLPEVREKVEPDAFHAGKPFDPSLLPDISRQRYGSYPNAVKLVAVVGQRNLYAAYFYGDIEKIGGSLK